MSIEEIRQMMQQDHEGIYRHSSVMKPFLLVIGLLVTVFMALLWRGPAWAMVMMLIMIMVSVATYIGAWFYFARIDPVKLQSERFQMKIRMMEHRERKGAAIDGHNPRPKTLTENAAGVDR